MFSLAFQEKIRKPIIFTAKFLTKLKVIRIASVAYGALNRFIFFQSDFFKSLNPDLIIDVGANTGEFILNMQSAFPKATIMAFEPQPSAFEKLSYNFINIENISLINKGLGSEQKTVEMFISDFSPSSSIVNREVGTKKVSISITTLDGYVETIKKHSKVLIKMDVEGYELEVLKGSGLALNYADYLYIELRCNKIKDGCSFDEIYEFLKVAGWHYEGAFDQTFNADGSLSHFDGLFRKF